MEIKAVYQTFDAAQTALDSNKLEPGSIVFWDYGTTTRLARDDGDYWPALVLSVKVQKFATSVYSVMVYMLAQRGKFIRKNARVVRKA